MSDNKAATPQPGGTGSHARRETDSPEAQIVKLRRSIVQQLTSSGKLLHAVFTLDRDYFGSRFTGGEQNEKTSDDPFRDIALATQIVETLTEELQGSSAFADSPVLRDNISSLVAGIESVRTQAIALERVQLDALHLNATSDFTPRTYPDNNPLACLAEAGGFMRELSGALSRAKDRFNAATMMLHEAEKARHDAEAGGGGGSEMATTLKAELKGRDEEVAQLRAQAKQIQEQSANDLRRLQHHVDHLRGEINREQDLRRGDLAEARSLAAEIERLASFEDQLAERDGRADSAELRVNLAELREVLGDAQRSEAITTAAESVLIEWARVVGGRAQSAAAELARVKAGADANALTLQQQRDQLGRLQEQDKQSAEIPRLRESVKALENDLAAARAQGAATASEAAKLRSDVARIADLERELARAVDARKAAEAAAAAADAEKQALGGRVATLEGQLNERVRGTAEELGAARAEVAQIRTAADESLKRERHIVGEVAKAREAGVQANAQLADLKARLAAVIEERDQIQARIDSQRDKTDLITREGERVGTEKQRQIDALHEQIAELQDAAEERLALRAKLDEMRRTATVTEEKAGIERDDLGRQLNAAREQFGEEQRLHTQTRQERDQLRARLDDLRRATESQTQQAADHQGQLGRELAAMREAEARLRSQTTSASAEANRAAQRAGELERELITHREQAAARSREHGHAIEQLRAREAESREKHNEITAELAQAKGKVARLEHELTQAKRISGKFPVAGVPAAAPASEVADLRKRLEDQQQLLVAARQAVVAAKQRADDLDKTDRGIIAELLAEVEALKKR